MAGLQIVPFSGDHLEDASRLLAARHEEHRRAEPLVPELADPLAAIETEWLAEGASGVFASRGRTPVAYLVASPRVILDGPTWMTVGIAGHAVEGDREVLRDLYAAAAARWVEEGFGKHSAFVPSHDGELVDAWFRLCFGASGVLAMRETALEEPYEAGVTIRDGTRDDFDVAAGLEVAMYEAMVPSPSFSDHPPQSPEEAAAEWHADTNDDAFELFVAERDGRIVGHLLLYRRPADLRVPEHSIDLAQASTEPEARGTGVGRALTAHAIRWAHEHGYPVMTIDWRMPNLWASRFWPRRGFRPVFLRLYRSIP